MLKVEGKGEYCLEVSTDHLFYFLKLFILIFSTKTHFHRVQITEEMRLTNMCFFSSQIHDQKPHETDGKAKRDLD